MQIKKFEAPTIQEALDTIKRELGPEAIILQTKKYKRGFGLMSKESVEVTAAVSERSIQKKDYVEKKIPEQTKSALKKLPAEKQAAFYNKYANRGNGGGGGMDLASLNDGSHLAQATRSMQDRVEVSARATGRPQSMTPPPRQTSMSTGTGAYSFAPARPATAAPSGTARASAAAAAAASGRKVTPTRYVDIDGHEVEERLQATERPAPPVASPGMSMEEEVRHLKRMIEELKSGQDSATAAMPSAMDASVQGVLTTPALQDAFEQLVLNGMDKRFAFTLAKQVAFELGPERSASPDEVLDQLAGEIMRNTEVASALAGVRARGEGTDDLELSPEGKLRNQPSVIALVGPTGVGKTTTVAKLASEALLKRNLRVGLINLDSYKVAAFDQLGTYAKILNVPFRSVANAEELVAAIQDFQTLDLVLIDTTGRSQRDPGSLQDLQAMLKAIPGMRSQLVLSVTTRDNELYDTASRFSIFRPDGIIVSKLDEATIYGSVYNVSQKAKLPLLYFTTGQRVPEDLEEASKERVAALILDL